MSIWDAPWLDGWPPENLEDYDIFDWLDRRDGGGV